METRILPHDDIIATLEYSVYYPSSILVDAFEGLKDADISLVETDLRMSWVCSEIESDIVSILKMKSLPVSVRYDDMTKKRFDQIREVCLQADKNDCIPNGGQIGWRKGLQGGQQQGGQQQNGQQQSYSQKSSGVPSRWRGQGGGRSHQQKQHVSTPLDKQSRYTSKFQSTDIPVEEKILHNVILNKLNKFSTANYDDVKAFLQQILDSNEQDFLRDFMSLVFKKAASEPTFCPLYARMISELSVSYSTLVDELTKLYTKYLSIFEDVTEDQCKDYEQFVQRNREKLHRLGYSQFLAELTSRGVLTQTQIQQLFDTILQQIVVSSKGTTKQQLVEEYADCLLRMSKAFQGTTQPKLLSIRSCLASSCDTSITDILTHHSTLYPGLTKKAQFTLMDCLDIFRAT